jgi:hypothetical protein
VLRATPETLVLVELCELGRCAGEVIERYSRRAGETGLEEEILDALSELCREEVLRIERGAAAPLEAGDLELPAAVEGWVSE